METILGQVKEIGIALAVVAGSWYLLRNVFENVSDNVQKTLEQNTRIFETLMARMNEQDMNYRSYVESNNHQKSELIKETTKTLTEVNTSLENHNKVLERFLDNVNK